MHNECCIPTSSTLRQPYHDEPVGVEALSAVWMLACFVSASLCAARLALSFSLSSTTARCIFSCAVLWLTCTYATIAPQHSTAETNNAVPPPLPLRAVGDVEKEEDGERDGEVVARVRLKGERLVVVGSGQMAIIEFCPATDVSMAGPACIASRWRAESRTLSSTKGIWARVTVVLERAATWSLRWAVGSEHAGLV